MEMEGSAAGALQYQVIRDETEVEATRRLRDLVLANISHEFRTPLSAQLASLELLRDRLPDLKPDEVRDLVLSIERGTLRLTRLIDNLLESTRIEAGHDSIRRQECALDEIVEEAVELMLPLIEQREQTVEVRLPYPLPPVRCDAPRLIQVFVNLLANANKFSPQGSTISVGGEVRDAEIRVWVEDRGPGLPAGSVDALFERFMRSPEEEPEPRGMGLGLYIVKSIMERHGGRVEASSSEQGTRMCVILPRGEGHEDPGRR
jgi:signal transduction histidine kinase